MNVKIINLDRNNEQIIVSEKVIGDEETKENLKGYKKGDIIYYLFYLFRVTSKSHNC